MIIREAFGKDATEIFELVKQVAAIHANNRKDLFFSEAITVDFEKIMNRICGDKYYVLVAIEQDHVVGVIMAYIREIREDIKYKNAIVLRIEEIVVRDEYRKKGIASDFLMEMKKYAQQNHCDRIETNVWAFNDASHALLKKAGFRKQQEVEEYDMSSEFSLRQSKVYMNVNTEMRRYDSGYKMIEFNNVIRYIEDLIEPKSKILDCAAGTGNIIYTLSKHNYNVVASDISGENVQFLKKKFRDEKINISVSHQNAKRMDLYSDNSFDAVLCMGPIYHLKNEDVGICIEECIRVVKPEGYVFISYLNKNFWAPYILKYKFPKYSLQDVLEMHKKGFFDKDKGDFISSATYYMPNDLQEIISKIPNACIYKHISVDGNWGLAFDNINQMSRDERSMLQDYIYFQSEKEHSIACGKNNMLIIKKA